MMMMMMMLLCARQGLQSQNTYENCTTTSSCLANVRLDYSLLGHLLKDPVVQLNCFKYLNALTYDLSYSCDTPAAVAGAGAGTHQTSKRNTNTCPQTL